MLAKIPIWVRVSGITTLVLVAVVVSSMLLGSGAAGGTGGMDRNPGETGAVAPSVTPSAGPPDHVRPNH